MTAHLPKQIAEWQRLADEGLSEEERRLLNKVWPSFACRCRECTDRLLAAVERLLATRIAAAREAVPVLIAENARLTAALAEAERERDGLLIQREAGRHLAELMDETDRERGAAVARAEEAERGLAALRERVASADAAWNIEVERICRVREYVEAMERDYTHAEAGHVRIAARRLLAILDTPVDVLRAALSVPDADQGEEGQ